MKTNFKNFKFHKMKPNMHDDFTCVFSTPVKFEFIFTGLHKKLSLALLEKTNYLYSP